jgi:hypothetical protein
MARLRHENPPRDLSLAPSNRWPERPYKQVTKDDQARRRKERKDEAEVRGKAIRDAEWMARCGKECPY